MEKRLTSSEIAEKVFDLTEQFNQYVFRHPEVLDNVPDRAVLVFLDVDDPAFNQANILLANSTPRAASNPKVYVQMRQHVRIIEKIRWEAEIVSAPLAA